MLAGAAFAAHKAAGDAACGVEFFLKLDAQGEEINAVTRFVAHRDIAQHAGLAVADHRATVGQTAHFAGLDHKGAACKGRLKLAVLGEGFQSGCEFVSHRDSPSDMIYFQRAQPRFCTIKPAAKPVAWVLDLLHKMAAGRL
jgi:hypothetical protein